MKEIALSTIRISFPAVCFDNPIYALQSYRVVLKPFQEQPKRNEFEGAERFPMPPLISSPATQDEAVGSGPAELGQGLRILLLHA